MSKFKEYRRDPWKKLAVASFTKAAGGKRSNFWSKLGVAASIFHIFAVIRRRKHQTLWRGKLEPGERIIIDSKLSSKSDRHA